MSAVVKCDGPGCAETVPTATVQSATWLSARRGLASFDFHTAECLAAWATLQPPGLRKSGPGGLQPLPPIEVDGQ